MSGLFNKVHVPTLGVAIGAVLVLLVLYHLFMRR